jgi:hypothetical protein
MSLAPTFFGQPLAKGFRGGYTFRTFTLLRIAVEYLPRTGSVIAGQTLYAIVAYRITADEGDVNQNFSMYIA